MELSTNKTVSMRCPVCLNFMKANVHGNDALSGTCSVCRSSVYSKQHSARETHIKIVKNTK